MSIVGVIAISLVCGALAGLVVLQVVSHVLNLVFPEYSRVPRESVQLIGPLGETVFHKAPPPIKVVVDWGPLNATSELTFDKLEWVRFESPWGTVTFNLKGNQDGDH